MTGHHQVWWHHCAHAESMVRNYELVSCGIRKQKLHIIKVGMAAAYFKSVQSWASWWLFNIVSTADIRTQDIGPVCTVFTRRRPAPWTLEVKNLKQEKSSLKIWFGTYGIQYQMILSPISWNIEQLRRHQGCRSLGTCRWSNKVWRQSERHREWKQRRVMRGVIDCAKF